MTAPEPAVVRFSSAGIGSSGEVAGLVHRRVVRRHAVVLIARPAYLSAPGADVRPWTDVTIALPAE